MSSEVIMNAVDASFHPPDVVANLVLYQSGQLVEGLANQGSIRVKDGLQVGLQ